MMDTVSYSKELPVVGEYDIAVIGGGTAGVFAAISAAMCRKKVILIEQSGALGGMSTSGLVSAIMPTRMEAQTVTDLWETTEIRRLLISHMEQGEQFLKSGAKLFNPINMEAAMESAAVSLGVKILFHTVLADACLQQGHLQYAVVSNKDGLSAIAAKVFIDCTGDGDLCVLAGVPFESGNGEGYNQDVSLRFEMEGVDIPAYEAFMAELEKTPGGKREFLKKHCDEGRLRPNDVEHFQTFRVFGKENCLSFNCPDLGRTKNNIDPEILSQKQIEGKKAVLKLAKFCIDFVPGFEKAHISQISPILGIRDSRRIRTEYILSDGDMFDRRKFKDGIAATNYGADAHGEANYGKTFCTYRELTRKEQYCEVPLRALIPVGVSNLLCAGRCIGTEFFAQSSIRIQHTCRTSGEAAGIAAAMAIEKNIPLSRLDGSLVRKVLYRRGYEIFADS